MRNLALLKILLLCVLECRSIYGETFEYPLIFSDSLASYSTISATSTCSNREINSCSSACPTRNTFPPSQAPLQASRENCSKSSNDKPSNTAANAANGTVKFNATTNDCDIERNFTSMNKNYFTLSVWIKVTCTFSTSCEIHSIDHLEVKQQGPNLYLGSTHVITPVSQEKWHLVVLRYNGNLSCFVDNRKMKNIPFTGNKSYALKLGPKNDLTGSDSIRMVDARWYSDALTDREVYYLYNGSFHDIALRTECRCPVTHPALVQETLPVQYMNCTNDNGDEKVLRLGSNMHLPEYMTDNNALTSWISGPEQNINVTLTLQNQFQIKRISLDGIKNKPMKLQVILFVDGEENRVLNFKTDCSGSTDSCESLNTYLRGKTFSYDFEPDSVNSRSVYEKLIADKIVVQAMYSQINYFTVSELKLEARCNCFGQDKGCSVSKGKYTCSCESSSKTTSKHCDKCEDEYFRLVDGFGCTNSCNCNTTGSVNNQCIKVGGQCSCRAYVQGRQCTECKHNSAKFSSNGCTRCDCNPEGITSCSDSLTCLCKQNVENSTGKCEACKPNYYNITKPSGCTFCSCDASGTRDVEPSCNNNTGQCECKSNVQGQKCSACKDEYFGLSAEKEGGCENCKCNIVGSNSSICVKATGQCKCVDGKEQRDDGNRQCVPGELKLDPTFGPKAGGTLLTLTGTLLGKRASIELTFDGTVQPTLSRNQTHVVFNTTPVADEGAKTISLSWTYQGETYSDEKFENETRSFQYKNNPQIIVPSMDIKSYASGGCTVRARGSNLDSVAYPKLRVYLKSRHEAQSLCTSEADWLNCPTPDLGQESSNGTLSYGFWMDGYDRYSNVSISEFGSSLIVVPDPKIYVGMSETFRNTFDKILTIKGERMNEACHDSDVSVTLGDKNCALLSRTNEIITCDPGETFPGDARTVKVKVKIGNKEVVYGELKINSFWTNTEFIFIAVGIGVFLIIIIVAVVCFIRCRNRNSLNNNPDDSIPLEISHTSKTKPNDYTSISPVAVIQPQNTNQDTRTPKEIDDEFCKRLKRNVGKIVSTSLVERCNIDIGKVCTHKGKKIRVLSGQYNASTSSPYSGSSLTIKTLLQPYPEEGDLPDWLNDGLLECTRLQDFNNDNVLRMKGIAVDAKNVYIIYPEMANKTLKDYLTKKPLSEEKKLDICVQVAEGMNFLSSQSIVHKDLAARNCWVSRDMEVKIADASFGFDLFPDDYLDSDGRYQPVRWMAPESLRQGFYDTKSDVWSYGVLIWEVFTNGYKPYFDILRNDDVKKRVCDDQYRLGKPFECSEAVFHIIEECHKERSDDRPNFFIVQNMLDHITNPPPPSQQSLYANQEDISQIEDDMEDYQNLQLKPPPRPPKGRRP